METPTGASPADEQGYEFTPAQNKVVRATGSRVKIWGVFSLIGGGLFVLGAVALFFTGEVAGVVGGIIYGLLALIPIYIGLNFVRAGRGLGAVVGTEGSDIDHLMGALQNLGTAFLIQIVAAVVWVTLGVLAAIAIPKFAQARDRGYVAAEMSDLRNLVTAQERFYADDHDGDGVFEYAADMAELSDIFSTSTGVTISITEASELGWAATSRHAGRGRSGCAIYVGSVTPPTTPRGNVPEEAGSPVCDLRS